MYQGFALTITSIKIKLTLCLSVSNIQNHQNETPSQLTPIKYLLPFLFSFFFFQTRDRCDYWEKCCVLLFGVFLESMWKCFVVFVLIRSWRTTILSRKSNWRKIGRLSSVVVSVSDFANNYQETRMRYSTWEMEFYCVSRFCARFIFQSKDAV